MYVLPTFFTCHFLLHFFSVAVVVVVVVVVNVVLFDGVTADISYGKLGSAGPYACLCLLSVLVDKV